jgi:hypothetical protein
VPEYGYLHLGTVLRQDPASGSYFLESVGLARTLKWGPTPSCVPGLVKGDKVILGGKGTSRDDLIILAKINNQFPGIGDIPGLQAALDAKADAADLDVVVASLAGLSASVATLTTRVTNNETAITALQGRATTVEGRATALEGRATSLEGRATSLEGRATAIEAIEAVRPYNRGDMDTYGSLIESVPRHAASSAVALANGVATLQVSYSNRAFNFATLRAIVTTAGTGPGTAVAAVYVGTSRATLILHVTQAITLTALGEASSPFAGGGQAFNSFPYMALGILPTGHTVVPQVAATPSPAHAHVLNPSGRLASVTKTLATWPANIDLTDGTWANSPNRAWMGLMP